MFYLLILTLCSYWLFFYKGQSKLFLFLPSSDFDLLNFMVVFVTALVAQSTYLGYLIYKQCTIDMFFIDWERSQSQDPHLRRSGVSNDTIDQDSPYPEKSELQVSIWRTFFAANQWNSLVVSVLLLTLVVPPRECAFHSGHILYRNDGLALAIHCHTPTKSK